MLPVFQFSCRSPLEVEPPPQKAGADLLPGGSRPRGSRPVGGRPGGCRPCGGRPCRGCPGGRRPCGGRPGVSRPCGSHPGALWSGAQPLSPGLPSGDSSPENEKK